MRHVKTLGLCLVAVFALAAMTASGASAGGVKPGLVLLEEPGVPAPVGAPALAVFITHGHECVAASEGTLSSNKKTTDKAAFSSTLFDGCEEAGYSIEGKVASAQAKISGLLSFKAALTVTIPGPCRYAIKKYSATFTPNGGHTVGEGEVTAKLSKAGSLPTCAKTDKFGFTANLSRERGVFESET